MKKTHTAVSTLFCLLTAASVHSALLASPWRPLIAVGLGPAWGNPGKTQTINVQPDLQYTYDAMPQTKTIGVADVFLGVQHEMLSHVITQLGLTAGSTTGVSLGGDIWQDADPDLNNLVYSYKVSHAFVGIKGKVFTDKYRLVQPYCTGSIGVGFNHSYQFISTPKIFEVIASYPFSSNTVTSFTYTAGIGLQRALDDHLTIGIGYEFADWGHSSLSPPTVEPLSQNMKLPVIYMNQLQFSISYVA